MQNAKCLWRKELPGPDGTRLTIANCKLTETNSISLNGKPQATSVDGSIARRARLWLAVKRLAC